jgi:iron(III) transport system ATP-binding protein
MRDGESSSCGIAMSQPDASGISVESLGKSFGHAVVFQGIDLAVRPGEFLCLLGPSGCGKTTLLRCIAGLERPDTGKIAIGVRTVVDPAHGIFVPPELRRLGMVFQHYALWPHMTVEQNILYPLRKQGVPAAQREARLRQIMQTVGLPALRDRHPSQLSGGQQQRVALARALICEPPVLLLDEPLSNLDAALRGQLRRELRQLHERLGTTTVLVTHDQEEAAALADTIAVMHDGRIAQMGTAAEVFAHPTTRFVAEFVGFDNFVAGRLVGIGDGEVAIRFASDHLITLPAPTRCPPVGAKVLIAARSDAVLVHSSDQDSSNGQGIICTLRHVRRVGRQLELEVIIGDHTIITRCDSAERWHGVGPGAQVRLGFVPNRCVMIATDDDLTAVTDGGR